MTGVNRGSGWMVRAALVVLVPAVTTGACSSSDSESNGDPISCEGSVDCATGGDGAGTGGRDGGAGGRASGGRSTGGRQIGGAGSGGVPGATGGAPTTGGNGAGGTESAGGADSGGPAECGPASGLCQSCVHEKCCAEYLACNDDTCAGTAGEAGELECFQQCMQVFLVEEGYVDQDTVLACAATCARDAALSANTEALLTCMLTGGPAADGGLPGCSVPCYGVDLSGL